LAILYIVSFIIFLYGLRIYNVNHIIDLRMIYQDCYHIYNLFKDISLILRIYLILLCFFGLCICLLLLLDINKFFINHIFNLYLYYTGNFDLLRLNQFYIAIDLTLGFIGSTDLITKYTRNMIHKLLRFIYGNIISIMILPKYQDMIIDYIKTKKTDLKRLLYYLH
jgi:hypothetical protein